LKHQAALTAANPDDKDTVSSRIECQSRCHLSHFVTVKQAELVVSCFARL
jgi:hypothetical protein